MNETKWMDACARRLTELADITPESADRIATRIWHTRKPVCYQRLHPALAAENWYGGTAANDTAAERTDGTRN